MAWCWTGDKPLSEPMVTHSTHALGLAWPQWVKSFYKMPTHCSGSVGSSMVHYPFQRTMNYVKTRHEWARCSGPFPEQWYPSALHKESTFSAPYIHRNLSEFISVNITNPEQTNRTECSRRHVQPQCLRKKLYIVIAIHIFLFHKSIFPEVQLTMGRNWLGDGVIKHKPL